MPGCTPGPPRRSSGTARATWPRSPTISPQAGTDPAKAARYCGLAAGQAEQRFAFHEAARLWEQALDFLDQARRSPRPGTGWSWCWASSARSPSPGSWPSPASFRRDAVRAALQLNDPALLARVITALDVPRVLFFREYGETDRELVDVAEQRCSRNCRRATTRCAAGCSPRWPSSWRTPRPSAATMPPPQAVAMARRLGDPALLTMALIGRWADASGCDGLGERLRLGGELLMLRGKPVTAEAVAPGMLMAASCGTADFRAADWHAAEAARIAGRYRLPTIEAAVSMYRAMRTALNGDPASAAERYREAARQLARFGLRVHAAAVDAVAASALLIMQDRAAEIAAEPAMARLFPELYALGLAAAGRRRGALARRPPAAPPPRSHLAVPDRRSGPARHRRR